MLQLDIDATDFVSFRVPRINRPLWVGVTPGEASCLIGQIDFAFLRYFGFYIWGFAAGADTLPTRLFPLYELAGGV